MRLDIFRKTVQNLPSHPGIYLFRSRKGSILYVGKAIDIKKRVKSYLHSYERNDKTRLLINDARHLETCLTGSEVGALLLEVAYIKKYKPPYNVQFKDDKSYAYIRITREAFPLVEIVRSNNDLNNCYGPFPQENVDRMLRDLRYYFPYRDCKIAKYRHYNKLGRPCLYGDINLCPAPCAGSIDKENYQKHISYLKMFIEGKKSLVLNRLIKEMDLATKDHNYERAGSLRDTIERLTGLRTSVGLAAASRIPGYDYEERVKKELRDLEGFLGMKEGSLRRIEAYDIANISGKFATGAMVVFIDGCLYKPGYRRFRIRESGYPNDYLMIREVISRRFRNESLGSRPSLVLVDGGLGQLSSVLQVMKEQNINIPVVALAKKNEDVYFSGNNGMRGHLLPIPKKSPALLLLQRIRDESHRFAHSYYTHLKRKEMRELFDS